jgi:hypothetical protein
VACACTHRDTRVVSQLNALVRRIVYHLTVKPGMALVLAKDVTPPALWQPTFVLVCSVVADNHPQSSPAPTLRVITTAFVGQPTRGDRPDTKASPFLLQLASANLLPHQEGGGSASGLGLGGPRRAAINTLLHYRVTRCARSGSGSGGGACGCCGSRVRASKRKPTSLTICGDVLRRRSSAAHTRTIVHEQRSWLRHAVSAAAGSDDVWDWQAAHEQGATAAAAEGLARRDGEDALWAARTDPGALEVEFRWV